jgi:uridine kinase
VSLAQVGDVARLVVDKTFARPATLGASRLVCVDGRAGSGKSTLGEAVHAAAAERGTSCLVHLDDLLNGWGDLHQVSRTLETQVLVPLARGRPGSYRRYDWHLGAFAEEHLVPVTDVLVVEGVGSGASSYSPLVTMLVWVEAPAELRLARGMARDGEALRAQWRRWMQDEDALFSREQTRNRADVLVDGTGADQAVVIA